METEKTITNTRITEVKAKGTNHACKGRVRGDYVLAECWKKNWLGGQVGKGHSICLPCCRSSPNQGNCEEVQEVW